MSIKSMLASLCLLITLSCQGGLCMASPLQAHLVGTYVAPQQSVPGQLALAQSAASQAAPAAGNGSPGQPQETKSKDSQSGRWKLLHLIRITTLVLLLLMLIHTRRYSGRR